MAGRLAGQGIGVTVVDPRWVKPVDEALAGAAAGHRLVVTVEDNGTVGGFGDAVARCLRDTDTATPIAIFGLPQRFLEHGERGEVLAEAGLTSQDLARAITEAGREAHRGPGSRSAGLARRPARTGRRARCSRSAASRTKSISSGGSRTVNSAPMAARWNVSAPRESAPVASRQRPSPAPVTTPEVRENSSATTCAGACDEHPRLVAVRCGRHRGGHERGRVGRVARNEPAARFRRRQLIRSTRKVRQLSRSTSNAIRYQR